MQYNKYMNNFNWAYYNNNISLFKKLSKFNKKNKFNYIENGLYNHVRDIFCLSLILTKIKISYYRTKVIQITLKNVLCFTIILMEQNSPWEENGYFVTKKLI